MSNIMLLRQLPAGTINLTLDADWMDQIYQPQTDWPSPGGTLSAAIQAGSTTATVASSAGLAIGCPLRALGLQTNTIISAIPDGTTITLSAAATLTLPAASVAYWGPPLDLTGISFRSQIRAIESGDDILDLSTENALMTNFGALGYYGWNCPAAKLSGASWPNGIITSGTVQCILDILASDGTNKINLCEENGPLTVNVRQAVR